MADHDADHQTLASRLSVFMSTYGISAGCAAVYAPEPLCHQNGEQLSLWMSDPSALNEEHRRQMAESVATLLRSASRLAALAAQGSVLRARWHQVVEKDGATERASSIVVGGDGSLDPIAWQPDLSHATGARLLVFQTGKPDGTPFGQANETAWWADSVLDECRKRAKLLAGGVGMATAIRTGSRTLHRSIGSSSGESDGRAISVYGLVLALPPPMPMSACVLPQVVVGRAKVQQALAMCLRREPKPPAGKEYLLDQNLDDEGVGLAYAASHSTPPELALPRPQACLVFTCNGRGAAHHAEPNAESAAVAAALPGVPYAGAFLGGEFGPRFGPRNLRDEAYAARRGEPGAENCAHQFSCALAMLGSQ